DYGAFNAYVHKDIANSDPAFVVEGANNSNADAEDTPIAIFTSWVNGNQTTDHRVQPAGGNAEAFGFYENSRLRLAARCGLAGGTCGGTVLDSQIIEWEGMLADASETSLGAPEPTADRDISLPNASGTVHVAPANTHTGVSMWSDSDDTTDTGNEVCPLAGLTCVDVFTPAGSSTSDCTSDMGSAGTYFY